MPSQNLWEIKIFSISLYKNILYRNLYLSTMNLVNDRVTKFCLTECLQGLNHCEWWGYKILFDWVSSRVQWRNSFQDLQLIDAQKMPQEMGRAKTQEGNPLSMDPWPSKAGICAMCGWSQQRALRARRGLAEPEVAWHSAGGNPGRKPSAHAQRLEPRPH